MSKPLNAPVIILIEEAVKGLPFTFFSTTHYRSPDGYVSYAARLGAGYRGASVSVVARPKLDKSGISYYVVLSDWSDSSSGMKTIDSVEVIDPTTTSIQVAITKLTTLNS